MKNFVFFACVTLTLSSACGRHSEAVSNTHHRPISDVGVMFPEDYIVNPIVLPYSDIVSCPQGWRADGNAKLCTNGARALGPFTLAMKIQCQSIYADANFCSQDEWPLEVATALRGKNVCMAGASLSERGECVEGDYQFGPFRVEFVSRCERNREQADCGAMRWTKSEITPALADENQRMEAYYSVFDNYLKVYNDVTDWFAPMNNGSTTSNGCVAFLSTAMRHVGVSIPIEGAINGKGISINTEGFEAYVRDVLKWEVIRDAAQLIPGDAVISQDRVGVPGHPDHVYMFHNWSDKLQGVGLVVDNQVDPSRRRETYIHRRNIVGDQTRIGRTPYDRHYRAPQNR